MRKNYFPLILLALVSLKFSAQNFGSGLDGDLTVPAGTTTTNSTATKLSANAASGATTINVSSAAGFNGNDAILIVQMLTTGGGTAGVYEEVFIQNVSGT